MKACSIMALIACYFVLIAVLLDLPVAVQPPVERVETRERRVQVRTTE
jgi:hypothetical protein